jgi:hypothetical protein
VGTDETSLIGGFIVTGTDPHTVVLRALGPSLADEGVPGTVADPILQLFDKDGQLIATNDNWADDPGASEITADGLAPGHLAEAATLQTLDPGDYTFVVSSKDPASPGIGLLETYDLSPVADSKLANISTRGTVATGDDVLIAGFIVGEVEKSTVVLRALGPSLASAGLGNPVLDPTLSVFDANGTVITTNDNWQDDLNMLDLEQIGLAPTDDAEAATIVFLPPGAYTTVVSSSDGSTGIGLAEIYNLE